MYLSGAAWLIFQSDPPWRNVGVFWFSLLLAFVAAVAVVGWVFVVWQLSSAEWQPLMWPPHTIYSGNG